MNGIGTIVLPGRLGQAQGEIPTAVQGSQETVLLKLVLPDGSPFNLTGATLTGTFTDGRVETYEVTGDLLPDPDQTGNNMGLFSWARSTADVGTPADFKLQIHVTKDGIPHKSFEASWTVVASQDATAVAAPTIVGVTQEGAAWLAYQPQVRGVFMQRTIVEADETVTIPTGHQMIVADNLTIDGAVIADGDLHII